ncbi:MAG: trypsin-like peptidase domain-containing protein, partial [Pseudonocardia sp.]|nr:trypsin-like peptidase domain-containing protein [Pseudonocardia sp.]
GYPSPYDGELEWWRWLTFITPATAVTSFLASRKRGPALATAGLGVALGVAPAWFGWGVPVLVAVAVAGAVAVVGSKLASWLISRSAVPGAPRAPPWLVRAARRYLTWTHSTTAGHIGALLAGVFIGAGLGVALAPALGVSHAASGSPSAVGAMGAALHGHASPGSLPMAGLFGFFPPGSNPKASLRRWAGLVRGSAASSPGRFVVVEGDGAAARGVTGRGVLLWNSVALARLADVEGDIGGMAVNGAAVEFAAADPHTGLALLVFLDRGPALAGPNGLDAADVRQWLAQLGVSPEDVARFLARHRDVIDQVVPSGTAPAAADAVPGPEAHAGTWTAPAGQALRVTAGADGGGTAFAVESGRVLTNEHVVRGVPADQIRVNGHRVTYVRTDAATDLAELHVPDLRVTGRLRLASARSGETVTIAGFPSRDASRATARVLASSSMRPQQIGRRLGPYKLSQYPHPLVVVDDMPVGRDGLAHGGSGAPMRNDRGEIVGMLLAGTRHPWMGFGIRAEDIERFLDRGPGARAGGGGHGGGHGGGAAEGGMTDPQVREFLDRLP